MTIAVAVDHDVSTGVTDLRLDGHLDLQSAPVVRGALLKCFTREPEVVLVDLAGVTADQPAHLTVFAATLRVRPQPASPVALLLHSAAPHLAAHMRPGILFGIGIHYSREDALAAAGERPMPRRAELRLPPVVQAPVAARKLISDLCRAWGIEHLVEPATVIMSELVTNAVRHARTTVDVTIVLRGQYLHIHVRDGSPAPAKRSNVDVYAAGRDDDAGLGLHLVDVYATAWGNALAPDGKTVWATLRVVPIQRGHE